MKETARQYPGKKGRDSQAVPGRKKGKDSQAAPGEERDSQAAPREERRKEETPFALRFTLEYFSAHFFPVGKNKNALPALCTKSKGGSNGFLCAAIVLTIL